MSISLMTASSVGPHSRTTRTTGGRSLSLVFHQKSGDLYIADVYKVLLEFTFQNQSNWYYTTIHSGQRKRSRGIRDTDKSAATKEYLTAAAKTGDRDEHRLQQAAAATRLPRPAPRLRRFPGPEFRIVPPSELELEQSTGKQRRASAAEIKARPIEHSIRLPLPSGVTGAESLAFDACGQGPCDGVSDGRVLRWGSSALGWTTFVHHDDYRQIPLCSVPVTPSRETEGICGLLLGLAFHQKSGNLYILDAYDGLLRVGSYTDCGSNDFDFGIILM
ncbi:uncharacterized protein LOC112268700 [Brachypodium distachyon]|uniref:uncharacterized protein LOC112268700 n=1 Tax=Brachypodium distachyon TaxID=15368 RepID=UPI000D0CBA1B|nr:uncharacterized protein LOC112268700 [Brachypodium distachyon]|eukprot:XP_024310427.1 uncharacterized protein LOC112268700 [Brachypodium distachyon]